MVKLPKFILLPIRINLSAGNINDSVVFEKQIKGFNLKDVTVLADRAYSAYNIIENLSVNVAVICIPTKSNMKYICNYDKAKYKARNKIERFFKRLKDNRRIALVTTDWIICFYHLFIFQPYFFGFFSL